MRRVLASLLAAVGMLLPHLGSRAAETQETPPLRSPRLAVLARDLSSGKPGALQSFWREVSGKTPLVEPAPGQPANRAVTFLWRGDDQTRGVTMFGGLPASYLVKPLARLAGTDLWHLTETHPTTARFEYAFQVNGIVPAGLEDLGRVMGGSPPQPDPLNPGQFAGRSYVQLPNAPPQPWIEPRAGVPSGEVTRRAIRSEILNTEYPLTIYTPPNLAKRGRCWLLVTFDGGFPMMETTLDNLLAAGKIPPIVVIGVGNLSGESRARDLNGSEPFARFLTTELVPWARKKYPVHADAAHSLVQGNSLGGNMALYCGLKHPKVFGKVLAQSPSLMIAPGQAARTPVWLPESPQLLAPQFARSSRSRVDYYLEVGRHESYLPFSLLTETRRLRDVLEAKGYRVTLSEHDGGHNAVVWRGSVAAGLMYLTGTL